MGDARVPLPDGPISDDTPYAAIGARRGKRARADVPEN